MANIGYIKLHRQIQECWIWDGDEPFSKGQAWVDLLLLVNHADKKTSFNGQIITIKRGQRLTSIRKLAERWKWSRKKVSNFLDLLESDEMITQERATKATLITIVNYSVYQYSEGDERATKEPLKSHSRATKEPVGNTNNNEKNVNNDKEESIGAKAKRFTPPTLEEVREYCKERANGIDPQRFIDYYTANGWIQGKGKPIKDWKACIRTWERFNKTEKQEEPEEDEYHRKLRKKYEELEKYYLGEV